MTKLEKLTVADGLSRAVEEQQLINLNTDQLISLNSTLVYVISQAYHGQMPILNGDACLIRHHSLLGIGNAHKAICKLIKFIEEGFEKYPTLLAASKLYSKPSEFSLSENGNINSIHPIPHIDSLFNAGHKLEEATIPKMSYFSSRYGFSEGPGIMTVAAQSLSGADTVRWSLLTVTHEMMHAHFDVIISELLSDEEASPLERFLHSAEPMAVTSDQLSKLTFGTAKEAFRAQLIFLASKLQAARNERFEIETHWQPGKEFQYRSTTAASKSEFLADFVENRKIFEECAVHALDLFYFYQGNTSRYIRALWLSWATVPGVVENLEFYILRSLVCVGYSQPGDILPNRFNAAVTILSQQLESIRDKDGRSASLIIERALQFVNDERNQDLLKLLFLPLTQIVEVFKQFCFSENLRVYFETGDMKVTSGEAEVIYSLETEELSGELVQNPVAFLSDRIRRCESGEDLSDFPSEFRRSAWVLLMLSS